MEDSYTVHRRRKAAARRREKTPEPPRREEESGEDDTVARATMERMVEATEIMEESLQRPIEPEIPVQSAGVAPKSEAEPEVNIVQKSVPNADELDKFSPVTEEPRDAELTSQSVAPQEDSVEPGTGKSTGDTLPKDPDPVQKVREVEATVETKPKKRSKDRVAEKLSYESDSSDAEEVVTRSVRRTKSPEAARTRSRPRPVPTDTDEDRNTSNTESRAKQIREKRHVSKHRYSTGTEDEISPRKSDLNVQEKRGGQGSGQTATDERGARGKIREKRSVSRHRYPSDTDEDFQMKKSESFPQRSGEKHMIRRSASEMKKQIIPLSDDSLIQDFAKAQEDYLRRERGILAPDGDDGNSYRRGSSTLRKRKLGILHADPEEMLKNREREEGRKKSWFSWLPFFRKKEKQKSDEVYPDSRVVRQTVRSSSPREKVSLLEFLRALREIVSEFKAFVEQNPRETAAMRKLRNSCIGELILIIIYCGLGAFVFRFTEGAFETFYKCGVKRVKRDFLDNLWNYSHNMREEDWKSMARRKLMEFEEQLHNAHEAGVHSYSGQKSWTFLNSVVYCLTVITTIGYGHISPKTLTGRALTIVYAIFGIPMFLIILADFGKLFTRGIKFLWAFVRRLYYTGSCRKVRRTGPVQEVMKGVQLVYDLATFRRPSQMNPDEVEEIQRQQVQPQTMLNLDGNIPDTPGTPAMSNFAIDDEFNLPISVAISILLGYIFVGATVYHIWESWSFFESFYFVFISMSTIGFGDYVPEHPIYMMCSIIYLVFGLALTSMCINVVQVMLNDSFMQASQKISATIGFEVPNEEEGEGAKTDDDVVEISEIDIAVKLTENSEKVAPKAKQEDVEV